MPHEPSGPLVRLESVSKVYHGGGEEVRALDGVSMEIASGEWIAVTGASGSGKSTLLHVLGLLDRPTQGRYLLNGDDTAGMDDTTASRLRGRSIGFVFQDFHLLPEETALGNVMLPLAYSGTQDARGRAEAALESVGLSHRSTHRPGEMSGGEQQRVAIARALVKEPLLVLADEPTGNLDSSTGEGVLDLLAELHGKGLTLVVVTHEESVARRARRRIVVRDGRIESDELAT
ncbi:MAG: ABC transporter ATP-binding protein [Planctomycetota bacterium]